VGRLDRALRNRLLPAILTATGVSLIAGGLLTYTGAAELSPPSPSPTSVSVGPTPTVALPTFPPPRSSAPSASPTAVAERVATRVRIPALDIDLPVIKPTGGPNAYPKCDVAMYIQELHQPGQGGATYLYAHARPGMFGPIYNLAIVKRTPKAMIGMYVEVFTSDDMRFTYEVREVRTDQRDLDDAIDATSDELWLQTSEGPKGTPGKTQLRALPLTIGAATHEEAHPTPHPVTCG
jgi:sortase (surface protein transpeptidase)